MRHHFGHLGRTKLDILTGFATVLLIVATVVLLSNPGHVLAQKYDARRQDDIRALMQAVLTLQSTDPNAFYAFQAAVTAAGAPPRVMLGANSDCSGSWGTQCSDAILADHCVDTNAYLGPYLKSIPFDLSSPLFSERQTGYYLTLTATSIEVGACNPSGPDPIFLQRPL